jgi:hypothetical protein
MPNFIKRKHPRKGENQTPSQVAKTRVETTPKKTTRDVSQCVALPFTLKVC